MPQERIARSDAASSLLPRPGAAVLADDGDEFAGTSFSILHFLLGGSLLRPVSLPEPETVKSRTDLGSTHAL